MTGKVKKCWPALALVLLLATMGHGQREPNEPAGLRLWLLAGDGRQEARIGYEGLLPDIEVAVGAVHLDAPGPAVEEWPLRGYLIAHALSAEMLATAFGWQGRLPAGGLYGGLFAQYVHDRPAEWSGGFLVGGVLDWPRRWQTVAEYQECRWNTDRPAYAFVLGLRRRL